MENASLMQRLRAKLQELDENHSQKCRQLSEIDDQVRQVQAKLSAIPQQQIKQVQALEDCKMKQNGLASLMQETERKIEALTIRAAEAEGGDRRRIRQEILSNVCHSNENDLIQDGIDVRTAEIRRQISRIEEEKVDLQGKIDGLLKELEEIHRKLEPDFINALRTQLEADLNEKLEEQRTFRNIREEAKAAMVECKRILEDLEERETLEQYAKNNGLVLEGTSTTELIRVCRNHQEKIAQKNAAVDNHNVTARQKLENRSHAHTGPTGQKDRVKRREAILEKHELTSGKREKAALGVSSDNHICNCPECAEDSVGDVEASGAEFSGEVSCSCDECMIGGRGKPTSHLNTREYFRVQEKFRKQDGLTIAGARNSRKPTGTNGTTYTTATMGGGPSNNNRRDQMDNGWTTSYW